MASVEIYMTLASRSLILRVLGQAKSVTLDTTKIGREVRHRFELREAEKEIEKMESKHEGEYLKDLLAYQAKLKESTLTETDKPPARQAVSWDDLMELPAKRYTIDDHYVDWLLGELKEKDWRKVYAQNEQGRLEETEIPVSVAQMEAIADLGDALVKAKETPISEKGKAEKAVQK